MIILLLATQAFQVPGSLFADAAGKTATADLRGGRKTVTVHNCDHAAEAMAAAEGRHDGWRATGARNVAGRVWQVTMVRDSSNRNRFRLRLYPMKPAPFIMLPY